MNEDKSDADSPECPTVRSPKTLGQIRNFTGYDILNIEQDLPIDGATVPLRLKPSKVLFLDDYEAFTLGAGGVVNFENCLVITDNISAQEMGTPVIVHRVPRYAYAKVINYLYDYEDRILKQEYGISDSARIAATASVAGGVTVGENSIVGENAILMPNVVIAANCRIGDNAIVKSGSIIGQPGFGIISDPELSNVHLPHIGGVRIGDNVEIGALNAVASGTILPTVIEDSVKTNDHVHIAHNCHIGKGAIVNACAYICGSAEIGEESWIGPNSSILNGCHVGARGLVGMGAVVTKKVEAGTVVVGNPARFLRTRR